MNVKFAERPTMEWELDDTLVIILRVSLDRVDINGFKL